MGEKLTTVESSSARLAVRQGVVRPVRRRFVAATAALSVTRLGAVAVVALAAYLAFVVPADIALLLVGTLVGVGVAAMAPVVAVGVVARLVE